MTKEDEPTTGATTGETERPASEGAAERVRNWLRDPGVALELTVERFFRKALTDFDLEHPNERLWSWGIEVNPTYVGRDERDGTPKVRETDVVVSITRQTAPGLLFNLVLVIECKSGRKNPWVCFRRQGALITSPTNLYETGWSVWRSNQQIKVANLGGWTNHTLIPATNPCYRATTTRERGDNETRDEARDALRQVLSAAEGIEADLPSATGDLVTLVIPVVVIAAPLFAVTSGPEEPVVEASSRELVHIHHDPRDQDRRKVWLVAESAVPDLAAEVMEIIYGIWYRA